MGCGVEMQDWYDWLPDPQTMTSGPQIPPIPEVDSDRELRGKQQVRLSTLEQGTNRLTLLLPVIFLLPVTK